MTEVGDATGGRWSEQRARAAEGVLFRELEGEAVILSISGESYFGLDEVGTRMWQVLGEAPTIQVAYETLLAEYDVAEDQLRHDLRELLDDLVARELIEIGDR